MLLRAVAISEDVVTSAVTGLRIDRHQFQPDLAHHQVAPAGWAMNSSASRAPSTEE